MRLALQPWGNRIADVAEIAARAEEAGFESLWTSELHRSAFVHTAAIAQRTSTATVGTGIALAFVRSPMVLALTALDMLDVSDGRFVLGLGSGVSRLNKDWHGVSAEAPVRRLREVVAAVRELVAAVPEGRRLDLDAPPLRVAGLRRPYPPDQPRLPVYLASVGPQMTRLAGEVADGWIGHQLMSAGYFRDHVLPALGEGLRRSGAARPFTSVLSVCCVPDDDRAQARRWAAGTVAFYATVRTYRPFFAAHGHASTVDAIRERFDAGDEVGMLDACPDDLIDQLTVAGTPDEVRRRVAELGELTDVVKLAAPTHLVAPSVTGAVQEQILETFAS